MIIRIRPTKRSTEALKRRIEQVRIGLAPEGVDAIVAQVAGQTYRSVVAKTPKGWTGNLRRSWQIAKRGPARYSVLNASPVMRWIERGTANEGTGRIYPRFAKALFIPLTRSASLNGWSPALVNGVDYIIRKSVRGITPRWIARDEAPLVRERLKEAIKRHIKRLIRGN